jgi:hypothetical protein
MREFADLHWLAAHYWYVMTENELLRTGLEKRVNGILRSGLHLRRILHRARRERDDFREKRLQRKNNFQLSATANSKHQILEAN